VPQHHQVDPIHSSRVLDLKLLYGPPSWALFFLHDGNQKSASKVQPPSSLWPLRSSASSALALLSLLYLSTSPSCLWLSAPCYTHESRHAHPRSLHSPRSRPPRLPRHPHFHLRPVRSQARPPHGAFRPPLRLRLANPHSIPLHHPRHSC